MTTPNFDDASHFVSPTTIDRSQPPHNYSLTHWYLGDLNVISNLDIIFLVGIFRFSSDNAFAWMLLGHIHDKSSLLQEWLGARLTKAYDVTIQRCRKSHAKIEDSKMLILRCLGSNFCVKFQRCPLKFHTKFWTKICMLWGVENLTTYDILELWHLKS